MADVSLPMYTRIQLPADLTELWLVIFGFLLEQAGTLSEEARRPKPNRYPGVHSTEFHRYLILRCNSFHQLYVLARWYPDDDLIVTAGAFQAPHAAGYISLAVALHRIHSCIAPVQVGRAVPFRMPKPVRIQWSVRLSKPIYRLGGELFSDHHIDYLHTSDVRLRTHKKAFVTRPARRDCERAIISRRNLLTVRIVAGLGEIFAPAWVSAGACGIKKTLVTTGMMTQRARHHQRGRVPRLRCEMQ